MKYNAHTTHPFTCQVGNAAWGSSFSSTHSSRSRQSSLDRQAPPSMRELSMAIHTRDRKNYRDWNMQCSTSRKPTPNNKYFLPTCYSRSPCISSTCQVGVSCYSNLVIHWDPLLQWVLVSWLTSEAHGMVVDICLSVHLRQCMDWRWIQLNY